MADDRSNCQLCGLDICATALNQLIKRDPPQIQLSINNAFEQIDQYFLEYEKKTEFGYHNKTQAEYSPMDETPNHLKSIRCRLLNMFIQSTIYLLYDLKYLSKSDMSELITSNDSGNFIKAHFENDYKLLGTIISNHDDFHIWIAKILEHLIEIQDENKINGMLTTNENVRHFETYFTRNIVFPNLKSLSDDINQYRIIVRFYLKIFSALLENPSRRLDFGTVINNFLSALKLQLVNNHFWRYRKQKRFLLTVGDYEEAYI
ncbi:unnamed protein product [Didymodactylos carnosus]|uniref:Uncharacterized protein n=1 Tax=Didymodactylos carnosus TaxID=1234261 RepID=A0A814PLL6_9BILA|nr:unnamed protein product [Didymodactylos carnosus]CAF3872209.1 unnamed protein product [Didymodactylos carnosus]